MSFTKYRAFIKVVELGNITRAARELGYSQPGVSHMLDALEEEAGFPLLIRSKDRIRPTEAGNKILHYCYEIIKNEDKIKDTFASLSGIITGTIKIGVYTSLLIDFMPKVVNEFSSVYSGIRLHLQEISRQQAAQGLSTGNLDLVFMSAPAIKGYEFYPLFEDPLCLFMQENHPFTRYEKVPVKLLNGCDFIMPAEGWSDAADIVLGTKVTPNVRHLVESDMAGMMMAASGLGVYATSSLFKKNLPDHAAARFFAEDVCRTTGMIMKSRKHLTPAAGEFVKFAESAAQGYRHD